MGNWQVASGKRLSFVFLRLGLPISVVVVVVVAFATVARPTRLSVLVGPLAVTVLVLLPAVVVQGGE